MDELVHHCIRELAFEGDLGCDVSRLRDFIEDFYAHSGLAQNVDDAYCAFIWAVIVQQPEVRIGLAPEGASEVYIAPQQSKTPATSKGKRKKTEEDTTHELTASHLIPVPDAAPRPLEELKAEHGDALRIAVDPQRSFVAITGSHIRPSKLTPMVYTALQFISRGRENGISTVDLSRKTGYDAKTCHYLVNQLLELALIEKRKKSGVGTNFCVHKYFFDRSEVWQMVQAEEHEATQAFAFGADSLMLEEEEEETQTPAPQMGTLVFDTIDTRHLSSLPLIRARLEKLLRNSPHQMHAAQNLLVKIGFPHPTKSDRRFFQTRLRELIAQGVFEKVHVPREKGKHVTCIHLVATDDMQKMEDVPEILAEDEEEIATLKANVTFHRQIVDLVAQSGADGITLNDLAKALGTFDKRIVEHQLGRLQNPPPPPHLIDLGIVQLGENQGRERRYKYFTLANYQTVAERETLENVVPPEEFAKVGDFMEVNKKNFYVNEEEFSHYVDNFPLDGIFTPSIKAGKKKKRTNPILPDGSVKKGRPRKSDVARGTKRKRDEDAGEVVVTGGGASTIAPATGAPSPPKRKRGRPPKNRPADDASPSAATEKEAVSDASVVSSSATLTLKKRGRPPKAPLEVLETPISTPRKRGRPPKKKPEDVIAVDDVFTAEEQPAGSQEGASGPPDDVVDEAPGLAGPAHAETSEVLHIADMPASLAGKKVSHEAPDATTPTHTPVRRSDRLRRPTAREEARPITTSTGSSRHTATSKAAAGSENQETTIDTGGEGAETIEQGPAGIQNVAQSVDGVRSASVPPGGEDESMDVSSPAVTGISPSHAATVPAMHTPATRQKRVAPDTPSSQPPTKRARTVEPGGAQRSKVNITQFRRDKEILRVVAEAGGVVNIGTKEFYEAHAALMETLTRAGEAVSTPPGSRIDKRTLESTLRGLELQGKIKTLVTSVQTVTGVSRQAKLVHLIDTPEEVIKSFLLQLGRAQVQLPQAAVKTLDGPLEYGGSKNQRVAIPPPAVVLLNADSSMQNDNQTAAQLLQLDDDAARASFLTETSTVTQLYGFIPGKIARVKTFHLHMMRLFDEGFVTDNVVSAAERVVSFSYFLQDLPVSVYCAIVSCRGVNEELTKILNTPEGRQTPISQLPLNIVESLEMNRSRSKARIMDLLGLLHTLSLVTPMKESQSATPFLTCRLRDGFPNAFDATTYDSSSAVLVPQYWYFNTDVPIHLWALSEEHPPLWRLAPTKNVIEASMFWNELEKACTDVEFAQQTLSYPDSAAKGSKVQELVASNIAKLVRRATQWKASYNFTHFQKLYLRWHLDPLTATTPLDLDDEGAQLERIATILGAPKDEVARFYDAEHLRMTRELEKTRDKHRRETTEEKGKRRSDEKAALAERAAAAKAQREKDWEELVRRVHPEPVKGSLTTRLRQVKSRYLQAVTTDAQKWEAEIIAAIEESKKLPVKRTTGTSRPPIFPRIHTQPIPAPSPFVPHTHERSIEDLIALQGPPLDHRPTKSTSKKGKGIDDNDSGKIRRRHRFQWNKDFDELARDVSAIIKARCRDGKRLDWGALEQIFYAVPRNTVRQRISTLREQPGAEAYFKRLEERWYELWQKHLGTPELPDEDPLSATNFNIVAHIKFLRNHIDKNALRVGYLQTEVPVTASLLERPEALSEQWDIVEKATVVPNYDFIWNGAAEEGREKQFVQYAFMISGSDVPPTREYPSEDIYLADSALKMALGTPNEVYDPERASHLLASAGESSVKAAMSDLLQRGIISKVVRDPAKSKPGRLLKISEVNQNAIGGSIAAELFQDASAFDELLFEEKDVSSWREWSFLASDGDEAALIELVSDNKVEFKVETRRAKVARPALDWNSKKTDDDDIEATILFRLKVTESHTQLIEGVQDKVLDEAAYLPCGEDDSTEFEHGTNTVGQKASCRRTSVGPVDCKQCLAEQSVRLRDSIKSEEESEVLRSILRMLEDAGSSGISKTRIPGRFSFTEQSALYNVVELITKSDIPLAYWVGYSDIVLVSPAYLAAWTVLVSDSDAPRRRVFPRRWLDIDGRKISEVWEAARKAVIGVILFHPGISQAELRWRLRAVYDRQEVGDILDWLRSEGYLHCHRDGSYTFESSPYTNDEEQRLFWSMKSAKRWYSA